MKINVTKYIQSAIREIYTEHNSHRVYISVYLFEHNSAAYSVFQRLHVARCCGQQPEADLHNLYCSVVDFGSGSIDDGISIRYNVGDRKIIVINVGITWEHTSDIDLYQYVKHHIEVVCCEHQPLYTITILINDMSHGGRVIKNILDSSVDAALVRLHSLYVELGCQVTIKHRVLKFPPSEKSSVYFEIVKS